MENGFVKLDRAKMLDSGILQNPHALQVFMYCLLRANYKPASIMIDSKPVNLMPGQFVSGRKQLAQAVNISEQNVRTALKTLENCNFLTISSTKRYSIFSIVNWDSYENQKADANQVSNQEPTKFQPSINQVSTTDKERKKERKQEEKKNTYSSAPQAGALPAVIVLPLNDGSEFSISQADVDEWQALYPAISVLQELRNMRGWLLGNPTKRKTRKGIGRFVHSWLSKAQDKAGRPEQRRLSFQEEREQRELEKFLSDDRPVWGMTGGKNGQDPF